MGVMAVNAHGPPVREEPCKETSAGYRGPLTSSMAAVPGLHAVLMLKFDAGVPRRLRAKNSTWRRAC